MGNQPLRETSAGAPRRRGWPRWLTAYLFLAPGLVLFAVFRVYPLLDGLWLNVQLLVCCGLGALLLGLGIALLRTLRSMVFFPLRALAMSYTYVFRGAPLIIVLYLFTFGVPGLRLQGTPSVLVLGAIALVITYGAYLAEVFRAGIESVHPSTFGKQPDAAICDHELTPNWTTFSTTEPARTGFERYMNRVLHKMAGVPFSQKYVHYLYYPSITFMTTGLFSVCETTLPLSPRLAPYLLKT